MLGRVLMVLRDGEVFSSRYDEHTILLENGKCVCEICGSRIAARKDVWKHRQTGKHRRALASLNVAPTQPLDDVLPAGEADLLPEPLPSASGVDEAQLLPGARGATAELLHPSTIPELPVDTGFDNPVDGGGDVWFPAGTSAEADGAGMAEREGVCSRGALAGTASCQFLSTRPGRPGGVLVPHVIPPVAPGVLPHIACPSRDILEQMSHQTGVPLDCTRDDDATEIEPASCDVTAQDDVPDAADSTPRIGDDLDYMVRLSSHVPGV